MNGLMMDQPLLVKSIVEHAQLIHPDVEVVSVTADNPRHRYTYREAFRRSRQLANVMSGWGLQQGDRVATLGWSDHRHLEAYYAICTSGYVCHTINPRLFLPQLEFIINHAEDQWVFVDRDFLPLAESLAPLCPGVRGWVVMTSADFMPETSLSDVCTATNRCWLTPAIPSVIRNSTKIPPAPCATPRAPRAIPRGCCIHIAPPFCTPW